MTTNKAGALTQSMLDGEPSSVPATFEPVAWGMPRDDGLVIDVICPSEHARAEGSYTAPLYTQATIDAAVAAERERWRFAGWFAELPSGMSHRLWEQGGHDQEPGYVALYEAKP